jgi:hypothetical protein
VKNNPMINNYNSRTSSDISRDKTAQIEWNPVTPQDQEWDIEEIEEGPNVSLPPAPSISPNKPGRPDSRT